MSLESYKKVRIHMTFRSSTAKEDMDRYAEAMQTRNPSVSTLSRITNPDTGLEEIQVVFNANCESYVRTSDIPERLETAFPDISVFTAPNTEPNLEIYIAVPKTEYNC